MALCVRFTSASVYLFISVKVFCFLLCEVAVVLVEFVESLEAYWTRSPKSMELITSRTYLSSLSCLL